MYITPGIKGWVIFCTYTQTTFFGKYNVDILIPDLNTLFTFLLADVAIILRQESYSIYNLTNWCRERQSLILMYLHTTYNDVQMLSIAM